MDKELSQTEIRAAYQQTARSNQVRFAMIGGIMALVLVPAGASLDLVVYPVYFYRFLSIRAVCDGLIAVICCFYFTSLGYKYFRLVSFLWITFIQVSICAMIFITGSPASPYYAGLNLVILATGLVLPLAVSEIILFSSMTLMLYLGTCFLLRKEAVDFSGLYNNFYFIILTSVISGTASFFHERRRYSEFSFSYELGFRNRKLTEMDRLKSEFVANISHELRTPLTLIISPLQDILKSRAHLPERVAGTLAVARNNALRLLKLVNDLLDVIRLEEGRGALKNLPVKLTLLLAGVVDASAHLAEAREVELTRQFTDDACMISGDPDALEKVFFNLLSNALKFTPAGGRVSVACARVGEQVQVTVGDTGIGIGEQDLRYVFDRFRQVDSSSTRRYAGTGLGLALVKELTEAQGGQITAHSLVGQGTTMLVSFPGWEPGELDSSEAVDAQASTEADDVARFGAAEQIATLPLEEPDYALDGVEADETDERALVLVVDDEPDMRRYLVDMLSPEYRVLQALDGKRALELVRSRRPDLVVLDLMLPELDGLAVCHRIKSDVDVSAVKLILLTARVDEKSKIQALDEGADDFLTKPFSSVEIRTRLRNLLRTASLEKDLRERNLSLERTLSDLRRTEAQLVQSEKLNALGSLAAGLLHEVNNPLNYAMTALQVARNDPSVTQDEDLREIFSDIDEGMQRIRSIVSDLRAFAYPDENQQQAFAFNGALDSALQFTAHELRGIEVVTELDKADQVMGSRNHIVQVLVNLFNNAAKAMKAGDDANAGVIRVVSCPQDGRLMVTISDNGAGMSDEVLNCIFDPFYTTADVGQGMGLGLSICHTIIQNHGGTLAARSTLGQGSEFSFDLALVGSA